MSTPSWMATSQVASPRATPTFFFLVSTFPMTIHSFIRSFMGILPRNVILIIFFFLSFFFFVSALLDKRVFEFFCGCCGCCCFFLLLLLLLLSFWCFFFIPTFRRPFQTSLAALIIRAGAPSSSLSPSPGGEGDSSLTERRRPPSWCVAPMTSIRRTTNHQPLTTNHPSPSSH